MSFYFVYMEPYNRVLFYQWAPSRTPKNKEILSYPKKKKKKDHAEPFFSKRVYMFCKTQL